MGRQLKVGLCVGLMIVAVAAVDVLFFQNLFWERLIANVAIVAAFAAFYLTFLKRQ